MILDTNTYIQLKKRPRSNNPDKIILHHTGGTEKDPLADTSHHKARDVEAWHLSKGWDGIGYHYVIEKNGQVYRGRPEHYHGAHTKGQNKTSIGICLSGNFDLTEPTEPQWQSLRKLIKQIDLPVYNHRDFATKTCPGNNFSFGEKQDIIKEQQLESGPLIAEKQDNTPTFDPQKCSTFKRYLIDFLENLLSILKK